MVNILNKLVSVTNDEKAELEKLVERNNSLIELKKILDNDEYKKQLNIDLKENEEKLNKWWDKVYKKYNLENVKLSCHFMNFEDNCIYSK